MAYENRQEVLEEARRLLNHGEQTRALKKLDPYLRKYRQDVDANILAGVARAQLGKPEVAEIHFKEALAVYEDNYEVSMMLLRILMDVWLPDFKFGPERCASLLSKTPFYWDTVTGNLELIHSWGEDFTIRHLVMPNHVECCTLPVLKWVAENMPDAPVNIMDQYHPDTFCDPAGPKFNLKYRDLARRASRDEILQAFRYGKELGIRFESLSYEKNSTGLRL